MIIKKVRCQGFDKIFEGYKATIGEGQGKGYGAQLYDFLKHAMVTIEVEDLSTIEVFYLKNFCTRLKVIDKSYANFLSKENEFDLNQKIGDILNLHDQMINDEDINCDKSAIDNLLPIGCEKYHVVAIFTGSQITSITGVLMQDIFVNQETKVLHDVYPGNFAIEEILAGVFYKSFYTYISDKMTALDMTTEFMLNKKFYQYADTSCTMANVMTPFGMINFLGANQNTLQSEIGVIKGAQQTSPYVFPEENIATFVMNTSFATFMKLYLNTSYVVDHENLKIVFVNNEMIVDNDITDKYSGRISNALDYIVSHKKGLANNTAIDLNKFNFIFNGNKIKYSLQIPVDKIHEFLNIEKIFGDESEATELKKSIDGICNIINQML